jgi:membrane protein
MFSRWSQSSPSSHLLFSVLAWPLLFAGCTLALATVYRFGPDRPNRKWRWMTWGSGIASILWMLGTVLFTWYVGQFGSYNRVYGDLGAAVGFLTWIWLSVVILLLGAEINFELERANQSSFQGSRDQARLATKTFGERE